MRREEKRCEADARVRLGRLRGRSTLAARAASAKRRSHAARTRRRARWVSSMGDVEIGTRARGAFVGAWGASRGVSGSWGGAASTRVLCACARAHLIVGVSRSLALRVGHLRAFRRARGLVRHLRGGRYSRNRRRTARARPFGGDDDGTRGAFMRGNADPLALTPAPIVSATPSTRELRGSTRARGRVR